MNSVVSSLNSRVALFYSSMFLLWLYLVHTPLWAAIEIWFGNEIYNHCLIVIPASLYLIYEKRHQIDWLSCKISWLGVFFFIGQLVFYILATAADIQLFQHIALFSMLPTLFWIFVGNKIAWSLKFPLCFVMFSVPVGEELVPFLQEITADMSVFLLKKTGIPLYRSGLFIEIPQGKFLVAEACSGVSFLIASIVLGSLYAYMNLRTSTLRVFFLLLSIAFPIFANALRVYGIIYIGYSTDMEHAVGADHLIYGWFFFAFVLVCLFLIGEFIRKLESKRLARIQKTNKAEDKDIPVASAQEKRSHNIHLLGIIVVVVPTILTILQVHRMEAPVTTELRTIALELSDFAPAKHAHRLKWEPRYVGNNQEQMNHLRYGETNFDVYFAYFDGSKNELVSSLHRLYEQERWTRENRIQYTLEAGTAIKETATSSVGVKKEIIYWYMVDGVIFSNFKDIKIHQTLRKIRGETSHAMIIAVAVDHERNSTPKTETLKEIASKIMKNNLIFVD